MKWGSRFCGCPNSVIVSQTNVFCQQTLRHFAQFLHIARKGFMHFVQVSILQNAAFRAIIQTQRGDTNVHVNETADLQPIPLQQFKPMTKHIVYGKKSTDRLKSELQYKEFLII